MPQSTHSIKVWDLWVRFTHWALLALFVTAYLSAETAMTVHVWTGYALGTLIALRLVWGFIGGPHARFVDFIYAPPTILNYLSGLLTGRAQRYLGHSPAGGIMVMLLLMALAGTVISGLMLYAYEEGKGPLADYVAAEVNVGSMDRLIAVAAADEDAYRKAEENKKDDHEKHAFRATRAVGEKDEEGEGGEGREAFWEETHETFVNLTLLLIALHILGVLWAGFVHRENLVAAMIHGHKRS